MSRHTTSGPARRRTAGAVLGAAALAAALVGLAACSSSSGGANSKAADAAAAGSAGGSQPEAGAPATNGIAANSAGGAAGSASGGVAADANSSIPLRTAALIKTASLSVRVATASGVAKAADAADQIAVDAGGSVFADDRTAGKQATAELTLKVPPDSLTTVLDRLAGLGKERSRTSSTKDVTTQVADVGSRVLSARKSLDRLRTLYAKATKVRDVIAIEQEIAQREADLESLQAQQRSLADETATATIHLSLDSPPAHKLAAPAHHERTGFIGGLQRGWHAFAVSVSALVTVLGAALPFLLVVLLAGAIWWRLHRRGHPVAPPEPTPAE